MAYAGAAVVVFTLGTLIWMVTIRMVLEQRTEIRDRTEQALIGQGAPMAETVPHELLLIDRSLTIIQARWMANSQSFDLDEWRRKMPPNFSS